MLKVGDKVKVVRGSGRLAEPVDGEVTKVGRVWATIEYGKWNITRFRMDSRPHASMGADGAFSYPVAFTEAQWKNRERLSEAREYLHKVGIEISYNAGREWSGRHVELADLLQAYQGQSTKDNEEPS